MTTPRLSVLAVVAVLAVGSYALGSSLIGSGASRPAAMSKADRAGVATVSPAVSVITAAEANLKETVLVTGTLVPRLEVLIAPEVEGLRVIELLADDGDRIARGQVLARLEQETLKVQLAQIEANLARATASIAQARSNIVSAEAKEVEAHKAYDRARPLSKTGVLADSTLDQRESSAKTAQAALVVARDGLTVAEADRAQLEAQRRDMLWKLGKTDVRAPTDGVISRRDARIGGIASANVLGAPLFRVIADGEVELEAEVPEADMPRLSPGQKAEITLPGAATSTLAAEVRLVSPEIDKATRQGRVRIALGTNPSLKIGSFARGAVLTRSTRAIAVPAAALLYGSEGGGPLVQVVVDGRVSARRVTTGLRSGDLVEIRSGIANGDLIVAKAGTFLRDGDAVTPVQSAPASAAVPAAR